MSLLSTGKPDLKRARALAKKLATEIERQSNKGVKVSVESASEIVPPRGWDRSWSGRLMFVSPGADELGPMGPGFEEGTYVILEGGGQASGNLRLPRDAMFTGRGATVDDVVARIAAEAGHHFLRRSENPMARRWANFSGQLGR